jgi:polyhydroxybutyrate depolymerase
MHWQTERKKCHGLQMTSYASVKENVGAILRGASDSAGPGLVPMAATLDRAEGARRYLVAAPSGETPGGRALVMVLHGAGASADQVLGRAFPPSPLSVWLEIAAREELVVIAPEAGKGGWSDCFASDVRVARKDDVGFVAALIDHAITNYDVDPDRVYLIGVSRGGWMAYRVAIEIPQRLAGFSVVLAGMPPPGRSRMPTTPLPALIFGCTADPLILYNGGKPWYAFGFAEPVRGIEDSVHVWRELAGLPDAPDVVRLTTSDARGRTSVTRFMWGQAPDGLQVGLYRIDGAGHAEPSRLKRYPRFINWLTGLQNADLEVAEAAWDFFREKRARPHAGGRNCRTSNSMFKSRLPAVAANAHAKWNSRLRGNDVHEPIPDGDRAQVYGGRSQPPGGRSPGELTPPPGAAAFS